MVDEQREKYDDYFVVERKINVLFQHDFLEWVRDINQKNDKDLKLEESYNLDNPVHIIGLGVLAAVQSNVETNSKNGILFKIVDKKPTGHIGTFHLNKEKFNINNKN